MRRVGLLVLALGCGPASAPPARTPTPRVVPHLAPPPVIDASTPEAAYRAAVAAALLPAWTQFLDDCRQRLPVEHPLNAMTLAAEARVEVDAAGRVTGIELASSGNADFDRAVRQVVHDSAPLPAPPAVLIGDDDRVHLRWLFARDRRQAGAMTARLEARRLPIGEVAPRFIERGELARLARRITDEPASSERERVTELLMTAVLEEGVESSEVGVRRSALEAIASAHVSALAGTVLAMLAPTRTAETRVAAMRAAAALGLKDAIPLVAEQLRVDITTDRHLAREEVDALVALDARGTVAEIARTALGKGRPDPTVLFALAGATVSDVAPRVVAWSRTGDVRVREAACAALSAVPTAVAWPALATGVRDRDATVRASCLGAIAARNDLPDRKASATLVRAVTAATRDRDSGVRAAAIVALAALDLRIIEREASEAAVQEPPDLSRDRVPAVRAAYGRALAIVGAALVTGGALDLVVPLLTDPDADVRTEAWRARVHMQSAPTAEWKAALAAAIRDPAPGVRAIAAAHVGDLVVLDRLASDDDDGDVRTQALVAATKTRGRAASAPLLLDKIASASPASADRVRAALAWHLAR